MNKLFKFPGGNWKKLEFTEAMDGLIKKGLAEKVIINNEEYFRLTTIGSMISAHMNSNFSANN